MAKNGKRRKKMGEKHLLPAERNSVTIIKWDKNCKVEGHSK